MYVRNQCVSTLTKIIGLCQKLVCVCLKSVRFHFDKDNEFYVRNECLSTLTKIISLKSEISASLSEIIAFPL